MIEKSFSEEQGGCYLCSVKLNNLTNVKRRDFSNPKDPFLTRNIIQQGIPMKYIILISIGSGDDSESFLLIMRCNIKI